MVQPYCGTHSQSCGTMSAGHLSEEEINNLKRERLDYLNRHRSDSYWVMIVETAGWLCFEHWDAIVQNVRKDHPPM